LHRIPLIEAAPLALLEQRRQDARALIRAAAGTFGLASRIGAALLLPVLDKASRAWLARSQNPFLPEIDAMARLLNAPGIYTFNVCFEWGCTSGVWRENGDAVLHRVMDWTFPALGEYLVVARQNGRGGEFYNFTWPGIGGVFQGLAPGRFAAAINQAPMRRHGLGAAGDWFCNRLMMRESMGLPPAHLLRQVFENAPDYAAAKNLLCETPIALPAIFSLAGLDQGCIIERTENDFALREWAEGGVCTANHFETQLAQQGRGWRARPIDSKGRAEAGQRLCPSDFTGDFDWFKPPIANAHSRLVFNAKPRSGALALMGVEGAQPVTEIFRL
jgi:hypothetical protein